MQFIPYARINTTSNPPLLQQGYSWIRLYPVIFIMIIMFAPIISDIIMSALYQTPFKLEKTK